ncbi:glycogen synthase [Acholeplasma hippikon]|uniref:Glycogen synthase n=1 Tax=Acholeplasma hippikon TaxID=264636 RepID=A0A449BIS1_9MOLU|nr:glycogen/starch synthase [Acholeplasma hippikon]VEU82355.1 Glycogen synthase 1 [Acholeplasma hippikon]
MNIAFVSSEVFPYSKTGGLADIAHFLPKGLIKHGNQVTLITPYYKSISKYHHDMEFLGRKNIIMGGIETIVNFFILKKDDLDIVFIQNMHYFERDRFYGYNDDAERFTCFSYAALEVLQLLKNFPNILHLNDWQTGMIPYLLDTHYRHRNLNYYKLHTLLTIHNLEYQGTFDPYVSRFFNSDFNYSYIHFERVNFLKAGIDRATKINTVSPNYKNEILTQQYGFSLDGSLRNRSNDLVGILNGIDEDTFNPKVDDYIYKYDIKTYKKGKFENKRQLYELHNLNHDLNKPLVAYVGRYANQKGVWMIKDTLEEIIQTTDANFFLLGSGDPYYENYFKYLTDKYPDRVGNYAGYNESLAHLIYAASDIFMMPSEFEPCGLGQMIAMKYGSLPVVRETGGLKDTVEPYNMFTKSGTGFSFANLSSNEFKSKLLEAIHLYEENPDDFNKLIQQAMHKDYTNDKMALTYIELYKNILGG